LNRKLIKQANQAMTITLPIDWIRENNLNPGDEITIEKESKNLILKSSNKIVTGKTKINMNNFSKRLKYIFINSAYAKGIDEIKVETKGEFFPGLSQNLGYAIIKQKPDYLIIEDIGGVTNTDLNEIFKRVFQMTISYYETAINHIVDDKHKDLEKIYLIDKEINKFALFLQRAIIKQSYSNQETGKIMFAYAYALEQIGDEITRIWRHHNTEKIKITPELIETLKISKNSVEKAFELYYQSNNKRIEELLKIKENSRKILSVATKNLIVITRAIKIIEQATDMTQLALMIKIQTTAKCVSSEVEK